jgi:hypothetical protein
MTKVIFDPEKLTFEIYKPTNISGCEVETWTIKPDEYVVEITYCEDGNIKREVRDIDDVIDELINLAKNSDNWLDAAIAIGIINPVMALNEFFIDVKYVIRFEQGKTVFNKIIRPKIWLDAIEVLPCYGSPECKWIRITGENKIEREFLERVEDLLNETIST